MMSFNARSASQAPSPPEGRSLKRLEFEMALQVASDGKRPLTDLVGEASAAAGADIALVLPCAPEGRASVLVRLIEGSVRSFVQVREARPGFVIVEEAAVDALILALARSSVAVMERIRADRSAVDTLALPA